MSTNYENLFVDLHVEPGGAAIARVSSDPPTSRKQAVNSRINASDSALRRSGRLSVTRATGALVSTIRFS